MELTKQEFDKIIPLNNYVVIKPIISETTNGGIFVGTTVMDVNSNEAGLFTGSRAIVVKVPSKLYYNIEGYWKKDGSMPYKTDMEVKVGDEVWFEYLCAIVAYKDSKTNFIAEVEGEKYIFIKYEFLTCKRVDGVLIGLNGNIILDPIYEKPKSVFEYEKKKPTRRCIIAAISTPLQGYAHLGANEGLQPETNELEVGMEVVVRGKMKQHNEGLPYPKVEPEAFSVLKQGLIYTTRANIISQLK